MSDRERRILVVPAPTGHRFYESQIAGWVGRTFTIDGETCRVIYTSPDDGDLHEGASSVTLTLERHEHDWSPVGLDSWRCRCGATRTAIV